MTKILSTCFVTLTLLVVAPGVLAAGAGKMPDIPGFKTLHCDFHLHTVFSDGEVWPTIRVLEALAENLDCIAITDHLKFGKKSKQAEVEGSRNRSFEIAAEAANGTDIIVIQGAELTQKVAAFHTVMA